MNEKNTSWGGVSDWYDGMLEGGEGTYQSDLIAPYLDRLVSPVEDRTLLDVACGQGFFARRFREKGAIVSGVDVAPELIKIATERSRDISYAVSSATQLPFDDASFDHVVMVLALQNIEKYALAVSEMARVVSPEGQIHLVLNHPMFRVPQKSSWGFDENTTTQYRRVDQYMSESSHAIDMHPGASVKKETVSFHRPLQSFVKAFTKAGLVIVRMEEWTSHKQSEKGPRKEAEDRARKEIPLFMYLGLKRVG